MRRLFLLVPSLLVLLATPAAGTELDEVAATVVDLNRLVLAVLLGVVLGIVAFAASERVDATPDDER